MNKTIKTMIILCGMLIFVLPLDGVIWWNGYEHQTATTANTTEDTYQTSSLSKTNHDVRSLIVMAASHFLKSGSAIFSLLNEAEMSDIGRFDFVQANRASESAATHLSNARTIYVQIVGLIKTMNVDQALLGRLREFDYVGYAHFKGLHPGVMAQIASLMSRGDMAFLYEKALNDIEDLLNVIGPIRRTIQQGIVPKIEDIRNLYLKYSDTMLRGFYVSLVFSEIR